MGALNPVNLVNKLNNLNSTQQSIETTSAWCSFYRQQARRVVEVWEAEFLKATPAKRLTLLYLANDILQNSRKKGPEFVHEFYRALPRALKHGLKQGDDKTRQSVGRLVGIWEERKVFGASGAKTLRELLTEADAAKKSPVGAAAKAETSLQQQQQQQQQQRPRVAALEPLAEALSDASRAVARSSSLVDHCSAALRKDVIEKGGAEELTAARDLLQRYSNALQAEVTLHDRALGLLRALLAQQDAERNTAVEQLQVCQQQLLKFTARLSQLGGPASRLAAAAQPPTLAASASVTPAMVVHSPSQPASSPWQPTTSSAPSVEALPSSASAPASSAMPLDPASASAPLQPANGASQAGPGLQTLAGSETLNPTSDGGGPEAELANAAASLAERLAAGGDSSALLEALASLPKYQQAEISAEFAQALTQAGGSGEAQEFIGGSGTPRASSAADEYNPEDPAYMVP